MSRYIDADDLLKSEIKRCGCIPTIGSCYKDEKRFDFVLQEQPTADVVEVVYARPIQFCNDVYSEKLVTICSNCECRISAKDRHCKHCGAKMGKKVE